MVVKSSGEAAISGPLHVPAWDDTEIIARVSVVVSKWIARDKKKAPHDGKIVKLA